MVKRDYKRKILNITVKRDFQLWLLTRILGVVIASSLVAVLILYFYSRQEISSTFYSAHIQLRRVSDLLLPVLASGALVSLLSGLVLALFLPQKIAGPIYRIQTSLRVIKSGDLTEKVILRKNDALIDLAESVNETTAELRNRIQKIKDVQLELNQVLAALEHKDATDLAARQNQSLAELQTKAGDT